MRWRGSSAASIKIIRLIFVNLTTLAKRHIKALHFIDFVIEQALRHLLVQLIRRLLSCCNIDGIVIISSVPAQLDGRCRGGGGKRMSTP